MYINELAKSENDIQTPSNSSLYQDACHIIDQAQQFAYHAVNEMLIKRNWLLGMRIQHEVLKEERAEYGKQTIKKLAKVLTEKYGRGFKKSNLYSFVSFYQNHQDFFQPLTGKSLDMADDNIFQSLTGKSPIRLSWIPFLMELGKGFAFVDRQKHIHTKKEDYYIDLVFYNYHLRCFVLIDLKTTKLCHQDVGQMDMYIKMYDELVRPEGHNPTIGLLLCADTDEDVAHYSVLNNNDQLFAAKYLTFMPTKEELRREIEQQKEFFRLQNEE